MKTQELPLRQTTYVECIISDLKGDPVLAMACFEQWPLEEIRLGCLNVVERNFRFFKNLDWAEATVEGLLAADDEDMAKKVLECYAKAIGYRRADFSSTFPISECLQHRNSELLEAILRLLLFAIRIGWKHPRMLPLTSRIVCENLREVPALYGLQQMLPVRIFLADLLKLITRTYYSESDWHCAERALRFVVQVGDRTFIEKVKDVIEAHEHGGVIPRNIVDTDFVVAANTGVLKEVCRMLEKSRKNNSSNLFPVPGNA